MSIYKKVIIISIAVALLAFVIMLESRSNVNTAITLRDSIRIVPNSSGRLNITTIHSKDIIAEIKITKDIKRSNNSIVTKVNVIKVLQGHISNENIYIYDKNKYFKDRNGYESIFLSSNNVFIPGKKCYVILNKLKTNILEKANDSYVLKDDLSVFNSACKYKMCNSKKKYTLRSSENVLYFFSNKNQVKELLAREKIFKALIN